MHSTRQTSTKNSELLRRLVFLLDSWESLTLPLASSFPVLIQNRRNKRRRKRGRLFPVDRRLASLDRVASRTKAASTFLIPAVLTRLRRSLVLILDSRACSGQTIQGWPVFLVLTIWQIWLRSLVRCHLRLVHPAPRQTRQHKQSLKSARDKISRRAGFSLTVVQ